jgi:hypothetical protein
MGEVINLRLARKAKTRSEGEKHAEQNRLKFGRTKSERMMQERSAEKDARHLDGHKLDPDKSGE